MSPSIADIELVVREVLAQLQAAPVAPPAAPSAPPPSAAACEKPSAAPAAEQPFTLTVAARVVTMNEVAGRLDSIRRLVVSREAIVTPAVRDELLRRGIALDCAKATSAAPATIRLTLMTARIDFDTTTLQAALAREGFQVKQSSSDCLIAASDELATEIRQEDALGVLLSRHTAAALCLANRLAGVRAIAGSEAPAVAAASAAVGANLLVVDPRAGTFFQLKQAITEFARGGVRPCPEVFRQKLG
jgi:hypothetical protein